ncbi:hypothetical protein A5623_18875 [Mycobacterium colombiense]|uniref:Uncharacterized protein n=1 Tax=Mycobacterium colombiense TaxID=339268 RepID=A0A853M524_9MYCO|nr:hypothetical protein A5623_18875 [Mycobacterium colombiense]OBJ63873.1 hypothetical protein A5628_21990 [Mycobacterium colombiense]
MGAGLAHIVGAVVVLASVDLVNLAVDVEVMNALLLPIVLGLLLALEARALPEQWRMGAAQTPHPRTVFRDHRLRPLHGSAGPRLVLSANRHTMLTDPCEMPARCWHDMAPQNTDAPC